MTCQAVKHDRWRTVWHCELEEHESGYHVSDGFMWADPGALVPARVAERFIRYTGTNLDAVREVFDVVSSPARDDFLPIIVATKDGLGRTVWPGEFVIGYDNESIDVLGDDRFKRNFRVPSGSPSAAPVG